jgi:hypothetical protein
LLKDELDPEFAMVREDSLELARAVWALKSSLVITTNYDKVLRWASPDKDDLEAWDIEATAEQAASLRSAVRKPTVWHLHGRIGNVARLILATDDYQLLYPEDATVKAAYAAARETLRTHSLTNTFLFVGCSFADRHLVAEVDSLYQLFSGYGGRHYALVHKDEVERIKQLRLDWLELIPFDSFDDLPRLLRQLGESVPDEEPKTGPQPLGEPPATPLDPAEARGVYGRCEDIRELAKRVRSTPLLAVFGLTGIGKSVLIGEVRRKLDRPSFSLRASSEMQLSQLYRQVAVVLGDPSEDPQPPTTGGMFGTALFEQQVQKTPAGLIHVEQAQLLFDDRGEFHDPKIGEFFGLLAQCAPKTCVILECREEPPAGALRAGMQTWEVQGLEPDGVTKFFRRPFPDREPHIGWELDDAEIETVHRRLSDDGRHQGRAHPLAMMLLVSVADGLRLSPVEVLRKHPDLLVKQLEQELFHDLYEEVLTEPEQRVLRMCALYRDRIPDEHGDRLDQAVQTAGSFDHLARRRLLAPHENHQWYSLHALIGELTENRISPGDADYSDNHGAIAAAWLDTAGPGGRLSPPKIQATAEAVHHLVADECFQELGEVQASLVRGTTRQRLEELSDRLKKQGKSRDNRYVLELLVGSDETDHKHRRFLGETLERLEGKGNDRALELYLEAQQLDPRFPQYLANLGRCWLARQEPQKYIEYVEQLSDEVRAAVLDGHSDAILADCLTAVDDPAAASQLRQERINAGSPAIRRSTPPKRSRC